jgi:hypothetical protein
MPTRYTSKYYGQHIAQLHADALYKQVLWAAHSATACRRAIQARRNQHFYYGDVQKLVREWNVNSMHVARLSPDCVRVDCCCCSDLSCRLRCAGDPRGTAWVPWVSSGGRHGAGTRQPLLSTASTVVRDSTLKEFENAQKHERLLSSCQCTRTAIVTLCDSAPLAG